MGSTDLDLLEDSKLGDTYRWFRGSEDPLRAALAKAGADKGDKVKAPAAGPAPEAPPLFGGVMKQVGAREDEGAGALTAFMTAVRLREAVLAERASVAAASSPAALAEETAELALTQRLLKVLEDNKGKFPADFDLEAFTAAASGAAASEDGVAGPSLPAVVKSAVAGEWALVSLPGCFTHTDTHTLRRHTLDTPSAAPPLSNLQVYCRMPSWGGWGWACGLRTPGFGTRMVSQSPLSQPLMLAQPPSFAPPDPCLPSACALHQHPAWSIESLNHLHAGLCVVVCLQVCFLFSDGQPVRPPPCAWSPLRS